MSAIFVEGNKTRKQVVNAYPGATKIVKVTDGYMVFTTWTDYETWRKQK